jgi:hypothetical protein
MTTRDILHVGDPPNWIDCSPDSGGDLGLRVNVIFTTINETIVALGAAKGLAQNLAGQLRLLVPLVVPPRLPLDHPAMAPDAFERHVWEMVADSGLTDDEVIVDVCLCYNETNCVQETLNPASLVVLGGKRTRWWKGKARKLEEALQRLGHEVVFIDTTRLLGHWWQRFLSAAKQLVKGGRIRR